MVNLKKNEEKSRILHFNDILSHKKPECDNTKKKIKEKLIPTPEKTYRKTDKINEIKNGQFDMRCIHQRHMH